MLDEYLKSNSLQPAGGGSHSTLSAAGIPLAQIEASQQLPNIHEEVEEIDEDEGMDGKTILLLLFF